MVKLLVILATIALSLRGDKREEKKTKHPVNEESKETLPPSFPHNRLRDF